MMSSSMHRQSSPKSHPESQDVPSSTDGVADISSAKIEFRFVGHDDIEERKSARAGAAKAPHKKSRNGCVRCRARRVKCDEVHPVCGSCERHQVACEFADSPNCKSHKPHPPLQSISKIAKANNEDKTVYLHPVQSEPVGRGESSTRRLLELKLMHAYNTRTCHTFMVEGDPIALDASFFEAPRLALENSALLYSLLSFTALHMAEVDPSDAAEMMLTHYDYWAMALQEHNTDLKGLSAENFDAVCMTSLFIRLNALAMLRNRSLDPYTPPTEWLRTTRGAMQVFRAARPWYWNSESSITGRLTRRMPFCFDEDAKFGASNRRDFLYLLQPVGGDVDKTAGEDQTALESTVSYIGGIWLAINGVEIGIGANNPSEICRRLILFPYLVHGRFIDLVAAHHPRALVILAYYFALLFRYQRIWWIGAAGAREVQILNMVLPSVWQSMMKWPLNMVTGQTLEQVDHLIS